ncbi:hypothetical protein K443DRAFT_14638 [Laccaria amethystina LaAM-08-1]|uniref:Uncharacterized protein n=1 Tax=Laccaria amethystina LaAM-08-1 TaxID=1095629 RepID=A0A0C9X3N2_9AGAR|nr:hypothetical protein K443DRAFT_14638 [Laccaria amethystina LaAM-08-1]
MKLLQILSALILILLQISSTSPPLQTSTTFFPSTNRLETIQAHGHILTL